MNLRRAFIALMIITGCFFYLIAQLMAIQLFGSIRHAPGHSELTAASVAQRLRSVTLDDGRGRIVDRRGRPIAGFGVHVLAMDRTAAHRWAAEHPAEAEELRSRIGMAREQWTVLLEGDEPLALWEDEEGPVPLGEEQIRILRRWPESGLYAVPYVTRYIQPAYAAHLLGFVAQHPEEVRRIYGPELEEGSIRQDARVGVSGLERSLERLLRSQGSISLSVLTDALGRPVGEPRLRNTNGPYHPVQAVTTLDAELQARIEQLLDARGIRAASVVVLDARQADVLVMANRPTFDPQHPDPHDKSWVNQAIKQQVPGSVFKLVVAAAALEYGIVRPHEKFICHGEYGKYGFACWKKGGHGPISFTQAFAESCNITFAEIARRLGPERIRMIAYRLGISRTVGWEGAVRGRKEPLRQFDMEEPGVVFALDAIDEGALIQSAIGQRDVRLSPLQAANMVVTILQGGTLLSPRVVSALKYRDGAMIERFPVRRLPQGGVSKATADWLRRMMRETVLTGTGSALRDHAWELAGKTGTAQTGAPGRVNEWFIGYGPARNPKVAAAVVVYDVPGASGQAVRLFAEIMDIIREHVEERKL